MRQYLELLKTIKKKGTHKPPAREGMPGSTSLFGYQLRHNLQEGFPLLTTKKMFWKGVVVELLWFLRGDTNIKYLVDNGVNIWNEDAYNYYLKVFNNYYKGNKELCVHLTFENFIRYIKDGTLNSGKINDYYPGYKLGDCGYQYGRVWRYWETYTKGEYVFDEQTWAYHTNRIDQIKNVITSIRNNPESRRHIVTAIDPAHDNDLALYWCHAMFQFNCRPLSDQQRLEIYRKRVSATSFYPKTIDEVAPKYYLDCQFYQRSADVFLGVPFNIASYALLTHIIAKICNMIPGEFIHTFGDVHIYDNHVDAVNEQLKRKPRELPALKFSELIRWNGIDEDGNKFDPLDMFSQGAIGEWEFDLEEYNPYPTIKAELSTGLKK